MKKKVIIPIAVIAVVIISALAINHYLARTIDLSETEEITINFTYADKDIHTTVTDKNDFDRLTKICEGRAVNDFSIPSCGFGTPEIIFSHNGKDTYIYPACDECSTMRYGKYDIFFYSIGDDRKELEEILRKYGVTFPCV